MEHLTLIDRKGQMFHSKRIFPEDCSGRCNPLNSLGYLNTSSYGSFRSHDKLLYIFWSLLYHRRMLLTVIL